MKKVSLFFSKALDDLLKNDSEFRESPYLKYALQIIPFVIEMGVTGKAPEPPFPLLPSAEYGMEFIFPEKDSLDLISRVYWESGRIEAHLYVDPDFPVLIAIDITFYPKGKKVEALLCLHGKVDSQYVRLLKKGGQRHHEFAD